MRRPLPAIAAIAAIAALPGLGTTAGAVTVQTHALVTLVEPAGAALDRWDEGAAPAWSVTGEPAETVQLHLELRTADGRRVALAPPERHDLDADGRLVARPAAPRVSPHETADVVTLVICRE